MAKNEKTSKRVASKAASLMTGIDQALADLSKARTYLEYVEEVLINAKAVTGSALTQVADKKKV